MAVSRPGSNPKRPKDLVVIYLGSAKHYGNLTFKGFMATKDARIQGRKQIGLSLVLVLGRFPVLHPMITNLYIPDRDVRVSESAFVRCAASMQLESMHFAALLLGATHNRFELDYCIFCHRLLAFIYCLRE